MHVRVRCSSSTTATAETAETVIPLPSRLTLVDALRERIADKFETSPERLRLFYGGKLLEDGYTLHDYGVKLNDVVQLIVSNAAPTQSDDRPSLSDRPHLPDRPRSPLFEDDTSRLYKIGDLIDAKDSHSAWFEGKIKQIVTDPDFVRESPALDDSSPEKKASSKTDSAAESPPKTGIMNYFSKLNGSDGPETKEIPRSRSSTSKRNSVQRHDKPEISETNGLRQIVLQEEKRLIFRVVLDGEDNILNYKLSQIRPRARTELKLKDIKVNDTVMLNYNPEDPEEKGLWYDFTVHEIKKHRKYDEILGTLHHGDDVLVNDVSVKCHDKIFAIESVVPLASRTREHELLMIKDTPKRNRPLNCTTCRDNSEVDCGDCGCNVCSKKDDPDKIILCDECNLGFHLACLTPPLQQLPEEDWYCTNCRRDTNDVIAPGKGKQQRKETRSKTKKDWGRGMACVGKTQTCAMPANHFGPIPGVEVGMSWRFRIQLSECGVHRPPVSGIHGRDVDGAYSIVLSGGYEDDTDNGFEFTYTGSGGRDLSGNKRTADQSSDQTLTRENRALAKNCAVKEINEDGADAEDKWRDGRPVRVSRSYKMLKHFPEFSPKEGIRYDGIYKVVKYYPEKGKSGFKVWKYLLRRDDPNPAPWEKNAKHYSIVYPDGYLEAEAEKRAQKDKLKNSSKKEVLKENNSIDNNKTLKRKRKSTAENSPPPKRTTRSSKTNEKEEKLEVKPIFTSPKSVKKKSSIKSPLINPFTLAASKKNSPENKLNKKLEILTDEESELIKSDSVNKKLWDECTEIMEKDGKQGLVNKITTVFLCIICQELVANPVTTSCSHNFCIGCLKLAFKSTASSNCPYCRTDLSKEEITLNEFLRNALRTIMPGYDSKRK